MSRNNEVGFSQRIKLEWLEYTSELMRRGYSSSEISQALRVLLLDVVSPGGTGERTNREKVVTILTKVWVNVPLNLEPLRDDGLALLGRLPSNSRLAVHWGICMAAYPFWGKVAEAVGRLLRLQGTASASNVQRRLREQFGERETVSRAARRVLRSFIDWAVLQETTQSGVYQSTRLIEVKDRELFSWFLEAQLLARGRESASVNDLVHSQSLFPFVIHRSNQLGGKFNGRLEFGRQGLDDETVSLGHHQRPNTAIIDRNSR
jgi:hypothetical protein